MTDAYMMGGGGELELARWAADAYAWADTEESRLIAYALPGNPHRSYADAAAVAMAQGVEFESSGPVLLMRSRTGALYRIGPRLSTRLSSDGHRLGGGLAIDRLGMPGSDREPGEPLSVWLDRLEAATCELCGGRWANHGMIHTRHANGGGSNNPCRRHPALG